MGIKFRCREIEMKLYEVNLIVYPGFTVVKWNTPMHDFMPSGNWRLEIPQKCDGWHLRSIFMLFGNASLVVYEFVNR